MAAGDILIVEQPTIVFGAAAGDDVAWNTDRGIVNGTGQQSAQYDLRKIGDTDPRPNLFRLRFYCMTDATPVVGQSIDLYIKTWDDPANHGDNDLGSGDLAYLAGDIDKLKNLHYAGSAIVDQAAANTEFIFSAAEFPINARYINAVLWNASGATLTSATDADTKLELTPIVYQGQTS